jgi:hypothetical protein
MKRFFLVVLTTLGLAAISSAQSSFHLGVKAGANLGKVDGQKISDEFKLGYQLGAFMDINVNKSWGIQPEVLFSQTNTRVDTSLSQIGNQIPNAVVHAHLNYLSIPILLRLNAGKLLTFNVGPQFSILMNKHETLWNNGKDAFNGGDLAAVLGAEVHLGGLKVYGRYNIGLHNISDVTDEGKWKSRQVQVGLGFRIL